MKAKWIIVNYAFDKQNFQMIFLRDQSPNQDTNFHVIMDLQVIGESAVTSLHFGCYAERPDHKSHIEEEQNNDFTL